MPKRIGRLGCGAVVLAVGTGSLALDYSNSAPFATTYAQQSASAEVLFIAAGMSLVLAGMLAAVARPGIVGDVALLAGLAWFAPAWVGWELGPPVVRTLAMVVAVLLLPAVVHLVLAFPRRQLRPRSARTLVMAGYLVVGIGELVRLLVWDPFFDPKCWTNCTDNVLLVQSSPGLANTIQIAERLFFVAVALVLGAICVYRLTSRGGTARGVIVPVAAPGLLFATALLGHQIAARQVRVEDPADPVLMAVFLGSCIAVAGLGLGLAAEDLRAVARRRALARILEMLGEAPAPGSLERELGRVVGDPDLRIFYSMQDPERYVDAEGRRLPEPVKTPSQTLTTIVRDGRRIAVVSHSKALGELVSQLDPALRLGLENERLQVESLARLEDLRRSRARIVETADAERLRLERDLHDGAQQDLVALSYEIRLALSVANADGETRARELLEEAGTEALAALDDLRVLAHGIYPAVLSTSGLGPALAGLADVAPLYVDIRTITSERWRDPVEMAAYLLVREAIDDAARRGASQAVVKAVRERDDLVVTIDDDGADRREDLVRLADRVFALGGTLTVEPTSLRGEIPCA